MHTGIHPHAPGHQEPGCQVPAPTHRHTAFEGSRALALLRRQSGAKGKKVGSGGAGGSIPINVDYYDLAWFNTPYHRCWHVVAKQTCDPASHRVPCIRCSACAVLGTFAKHLLDIFFSKM